MVLQLHMCGLGVVISWKGWCGAFIVALLPHLVPGKEWLEGWAQLSPSAAPCALSSWVSDSPDVDSGLPEPVSKTWKVEAVGL